MLHITWENRVLNNVVLFPCSRNSMYTIVAVKRFKWACHVQRMSEDRLTKAIYSELADGTDELADSKGATKTLQKTL